MLSSAGRQAHPRVVQVRVPRLAAAVVGVVILPLSLSACGMFGGNGKDEVPVVIPTQVEGASPADTASPSAPASTPVDSANAAPADPAPATSIVNNTVTKTGIVVQEKTRTATRNVTATKTLPQVSVTNTVTAAPITVTETQTQTVTRTSTVTGPGSVTTVTKFCAVGQPTC